MPSAQLFGFGAKYIHAVSPFLRDAENRYSHLQERSLAEEVFTIEETDTIKTALDTCVRCLIAHGLLHEGTTTEALLRSPADLDQAMRDVDELEAIGLLKIHNSLGIEAAPNDPLGACARTRCDIEKLIMKKSIERSSDESRGEVKVMETEYLDVFVIVPRFLSLDDDDAYRDFSVKITPKADKPVRLQSFNTGLLQTGKTNSYDHYMDRDGVSLVFSKDSLRGDLYEEFNGDYVRIAQFVEKYLLEWSLEAEDADSNKPVSPEGRALYDQLLAS